MKSTTHLTSAVVAKKDAEQVAQLTEEDEKAYVDTKDQDPNKQPLNVLHIFRSSAHNADELSFHNNDVKTLHASLFANDNPNNVVSGVPQEVQKHYNEEANTHAKASSLSIFRRSYRNVLPRGAGG